MAMTYFLPILVTIGIAAFMAKSRHLRLLYGYVVGVAIVGLVVLSGFRGTDSTVDTASYFNGFVYLRDHVHGPYEPGFVILMRLFHVWTDNFNVFLIGFTVAFILIGIRVITLYLKEEFGLAILFFLPYFYFNGVFQTMRSAIASLILMVALPHLLDERNRRPLVFIALLILAASFHYGVLFFLPCLLFVRIKITRTLGAIMMFTIMLAAIGTLTSFNHKILEITHITNLVPSVYLTGQFGKRRPLFDPGTLLQIVVVFVAILYRDDLRSTVRYFDFICVVYFFSTFYLLFFSSFGILASRVALILRTPFFILIPAIISERRSGSTYWLKRFLGVALGVGYSVYTIQIVLHNYTFIGL